jgi:Cu(I)/Ag(I) efflux system membrane fusion protein
MITFSSTASRRIRARLPAAFSTLLLLTACSKTPEAPAATTATAVATPAPPPAAADRPADKDGRTVLYYYDPMKPEAHFDHPGKSPFMDMDLMPKYAEPAPDATTAPPAPASSDGRRVLYYYDPMKPDVHFDHPGKSPFMEMELVPKYAEETPSPGVAVNADILQSLGIRTAHPVRQDVRPSVRVPARVVADASGQARLQSRVSGWIERLHVRAPGQSIVAGAIVAEIYSPELVQAQEELLLGVDTAGPAAERLRRLGIADGDIQAIKRSGHAARRLPLRAPVSGVVTELGVREGASVSPDTLIMDVSARNAVWIEAQLFPAQQVGLGASLSARFTLPGVANREWRSSAGQVVPVADPMTQTLAVRFPISNRDDLPLGAVLDAEIEGSARSNVLLVPVEAVIRTTQGDRVMVEREANRFAAVPVRLGQRYGQQLEILEGLTETDAVVTSGQFLLDAEANLQSGLSQMDANAVTTTTGAAP